MRPIFIFLTRIKTKIKIIANPTKVDPRIVEIRSSFSSINIFLKKV
jgi:hypothetical protein